MATFTKTLGNTIKDQDTLIDRLSKEIPEGCFFIEEGVIEDSIQLIVRLDDNISNTLLFELALLIGREIGQI